MSKFSNATLRDMKSSLEKVYKKGEKHPYLNNYETKMQYIIERLGE